MIHGTADVQTAAIGSGTRIWQFCVILRGARIGSDCNICSHCFIENDVVLGNRITVKSGVQLWDGLVVEDEVHIGPCATFTNHLRPRSQQYAAKWPTTTLRRGCSIGANATILPGLTIGQGAMIGAGTVVTKDVADFALVTGNPGRPRGWVCRCGAKLGSFTSGAYTCTCGKSFRLIEGRVTSEQA